MEKIINSLKEIIRITSLKVSDQVILEQSVKIYLSNLIQSGKEKNIQSMKEDVNKAIGIESPTDKQINFLKKSGYNGTMPKTKLEAKELISRYINDNKREY